MTSVHFLVSFSISCWVNVLLCLGCAILFGKFGVGLVWLDESQIVIYAQLAWLAVVESLHIDGFRSSPALSTSERILSDVRC